MDALTIILSAHQKNWWPYYAVMATLGGLIGGYSTYMLGVKGGQEALERSCTKIKRKKSTISSTGLASGVFCSGDAAAAGPVLAFFADRGHFEISQEKLFSCRGDGPRHPLFFAGLSGIDVQQTDLRFFHAYYQRTLWTAVALAVIGGLAAFIWSWRRKRRGKPVTPMPIIPTPGRRSNTSVNIMAYAVARPDAPANRASSLAWSNMNFCSSFVSAVRTTSLAFPSPSRALPM